MKKELQAVPFQSTVILYCVRRFVIIQFITHQSLIMEAENGYEMSKFYLNVASNRAFNEDNNNQIDFKERMRNADNTYSMLQISFKNKNISKKLKLRLKNTIIDKTLTYASETWTLTKRDRKQLNIFERKVYRRILGPVYDNEEENWRILTNKEIYAIVKKNLL